MLTDMSFQTRCLLMATSSASFRLERRVWHMGMPNINQ